MPKSKSVLAAAPKKAKGGKGLAKLKSFLRPEHFVVKPKEPPSVYIPWKAYLVSSIHVEKQLKDHEGYGFKLLTALGIAKAVTHPSIFVNEEVSLSLDNLLVLQVLEIARKKKLPNEDRPLVIIRAKDWPSATKNPKNRTVNVGDETLGTVIRCIVKPGDLVIITGATKFPPEKEADENTEFRGLAIKTKQLEKIPQYVYVFKRGDNVPLKPTTIPDLPRSLNVSEKLTLSKYDQTVFRVMFADSDMILAPAPPPPKRKRVEETSILSKNKGNKTATQKKKNDKSQQRNEARQTVNNYESIDQITDEEEHHSSVEIVEETPPEDNSEQLQQEQQQSQQAGNEKQQTQEEEMQISEDSQDLRQTQFANLLESQMLGSMPTLDEDSQQTQQSQVSQQNKIPMEKQNPQLHSQLNEICLPPPSYSHKSSSAASEDSHKAQANTTNHLLSPAPSNNIEKELNTPDDTPDRFDDYVERELGHLLIDVEDNNSSISEFADKVDDKEEEGAEAEDIVPSSSASTMQSSKSNKSNQPRFHSQPVYVDEFRAHGIIQNPLCPLNMTRAQETKNDNDGAVRMRQCFVNLASIQLKHQLIDMQPKD